MAEKTWGYLTKALISVLVLAMLVASYNLLMTIFDRYEWEHPKSGDWATWFGAGGTIAAFCATIRIATTETRRRKKQDAELANLNAAAIHHDLARLITLSKNVVRWLEINNPLTVEFSEMQTLANKFRIMKTCSWSMEDLAKLGPIGNQTALKIAAAQSRISYLSHFIEEKVPAHWEALSDERRRRIYTIIKEQANIAADELSSAMKSIKRALRKVGFFPRPSAQADIDTLLS